MSVIVNTILERKGHDVVTVSPDLSVVEAAGVLSEHNIGAVVVSEDGNSIEGILSERDIVRRLVDDGGGDCLQLPVTDLMTEEVATCGLGDHADELMTVMTNSRLRHLPVVEDGRMIGIVSIGDLVKSRIDDLKTQTESLKNYVTGSGY